MPTSSTAKPKSAGTARKAAPARTKKSATKKTAATKAASKAKKQQSLKGKVLVCATPNQCFWTNDGQILATMVELRDALATMSDELFAYHVTKERNDFADWVEQVLIDASCAADLRSRRTKKTAHAVVVKHLKAYVI